MSSGFWRRMLALLSTNPLSLTEHPSVANQSLDANLVRQAAQVQRLTELGPREVREVNLPQLLDDGHLTHLLRVSLHRGARLWMITLPDEAARDLVEELFPGLLFDLSTKTRLAVGLRPDEVARHLIHSKPEIAKRFDGMDTIHVPRDIITSLQEGGADVSHHWALNRWLRKPRTIIYLTVFLYSSLRALPVMFVHQFHGHWWVLWLIDIVTAVPYTWGLLAMVLAPRRRTRALGALVTVVTFMAPYIYFWSFGRHYPPYIWLVIIALIASAFLIEAWKFKQEKTLIARYANVSPAQPPSESR